MHCYIEIVLSSIYQDEMHFKVKYPNTRLDKSNAIWSTIYHCNLGWILKLKNLFGQ